jgi:hypothetical protein
VAVVRVEAAVAAEVVVVDVAARQQPPQPVPLQISSRKSPMPSIKVTRLR